MIHADIFNPDWGFDEAQFQRERALQQACVSRSTKLLFGIVTTSLGYTFYGYPPISMPLFGAALGFFVEAWMDEREIYRLRMRIITARLLS